ncbi:MAG: hypothetical protein HDT22_00255 [Ruminococcus sp.]|nr:hypothetical protein [Ruminococcus sp.]
MGLMDILNKDLGELLESSFDSYAEKRADEIEIQNFARNCLPVVSFDRCYKWAVEMKKDYPQSAGFIIAVKENPDPRNENDRICVIVGMLDAQNKSISMDGVKSISTIFHGKTIDSKMIDCLNGREKLIVKFK